MSGHIGAGGLPGVVNRLDLEMLRSAFPDWRLGGAPGSWFAVRGGVVPDSGPRSLLRCYLSASTLVELAELLCLQEYLDGLSDPELAVVWQRVELPRPAKDVVR